jgi:hypothetical protein
LVPRRTIWNNFFIGTTNAQKNILNFKNNMGIGFFTNREEEVPPGQDIEPIRAAPRERPHMFRWQGDGSGVIAAGYDHSVILGVDDGTVFTFGNGSEGQLGTGELGQQRQPTQILEIPRAACVSAGRSITAIVTQNKELLICGYVTDDMSRIVVVPRAVDPRLNNVMGVTCGDNFTVAITEDGTAFGFGASQTGQLGMIAYRTPLRQIPRATGVAAVSAGMSHCIFLFYDGTVATIGWNYFGQLGNGTRTQSSDLVFLPEIEHVICISAGQTSSALVTNDGRVATWGNGQFGNLGHGECIHELRPRFIDGIFDALTVSCGYNHTAIVHRDGSVSTFGQGRDLDEDDNEITGWLGHGDDSRDKLVPQKIAGLDDAVAVSCGRYHTIIQHFDGQVSTCGLNNKGQLGRDGPDFSRPDLIEY